jgi:hypothetical protein
MQKKMLFITAVTMLFLVTGASAIVYAESTTSSMPTFTWQDAEEILSYMAIAAFFAVLHDVNDSSGVIILPHKTSGGTWDLGIITPALFGTAAGFFAQLAQSIPFLNGLFPTLSSTPLPGALAAVFAGYFYSKTIQVVLGKIQTNTSTIPSATTQPATPPS